MGAILEFIDLARCNESQFLTGSVSESSFLSLFPDSNRGLLVESLLVKLHSRVCRNIPREIPIQKQKELDHSIEISYETACDSNEPQTSSEGMFGLRSSR